MRATNDLGLYIHAPFCKHECPYCDFYKIELRSRPARERLDFPARLAAELKLRLQESPELARRELSTIYIGGGTPSTLSPAGVAAFIDGVMKQFKVAGDIEVTLEANPENLTAVRAAKWRQAGFNRLSIGVQSFDAEELKLLERLHEPALIGEAVRNARAAGFDNLSLDLMFALPNQSLETWKNNLRAAVALDPDHISFYGLTYHENTAFENWRKAGQLKETDEELQAEMYLWGADCLREGGFEHYEISNFARPGKRSRHNQRYWRRADVLGLGPGAHSNISAARFANPDDLDAWAAALDAGRLPAVQVEELLPAAAEEERLFTQLRRVEGLSRANDSALYQRCVDWLHAQPYEARKLMTADLDSARLTAEGWLVSDAIIARLISMESR
ncbi:radical SAM family heme chaperone HemW [soil metagenome]